MSVFREKFSTESEMKDGTELKERLEHERAVCSTLEEWYNQLIDKMDALKAENAQLKAENRCFADVFRAMDDARALLLNSVDWKDL